MGYKIITDSTIDMDHKMIEELGLTVVPLRFTIDGKTYKDKADLSDMPTETFYAKLREGKMSTTSQINADEFTRVFEPVLQGGEDVLYIAFSSGLSGTCQSAFIARDELKEKISRAQNLCVRFALRVPRRRFARIPCSHAEARRHGH